MHSLAWMLLLAPAFAQEETVVSTNPLMIRHAAEGSTPEGAIALWITACLYVQSGDPVKEAHGVAALTELTLPFRDDPDWRKRPSNGTFTDRLKSDRNVFRSYYKGARPENGYQADIEAYVVEVTRQEPGPDGKGLKVFIRSGGADSPRPVVVKKSTKSGLWYMEGFNNLYVGIRPVVDPDAERFE